MTHEQGREISCLVMILILGTDGLSCSREARPYNHYVALGFLVVAVVSALGISVLTTVDNDAGCK